MAKTATQLDRDIDKALGETFELKGIGGHYKVRVAPDPHRGGYSAKLVSDGIGVIMEPNGRTPQEALRQLTTELRSGFQTGDRQLASEIERVAKRSARK